MSAAIHTERDIELAGDAWEDDAGCSHGEIAIDRSRGVAFRSRVAFPVVCKLCARRAFIVDDPPEDWLRENPSRYPVEMGTTIRKSA